VSVLHDTGYRTVLTALPATFGLTIQNDTEISGVLNDTKSTFCTSSTSSLPSSQTSLTLRIAVVLRGECKFAKKAENAAKDGYKGLIILDTETNTNVERISGVRSLLTDNIAVVFLLRNEATILQELLSKSPNRTATLSDSSTFSWFKKSTTATTTTMSSTTKPATTTTSYSNMFLSKLIPSGNIFNIHNTKRKGGFKPSGGSNIQDASVMMILEDGEKGIVDVTPLTIGSISVGVVVAILLFISIITLIVSKIRRHRRRRTQHTRCQQAIRQFDAMNRSLGQDNSGYSGENGASSSLNRILPKSTYSLLECPVCLEIAWPPKKIFQCREGHIICDTCKANPNLKNCPMCRIPLSSHLTSRNRSLEELARTLMEESSVSPHQDQIPSIIISVPSAPPPPDIVTSISEVEVVTEPINPDPEAANDTNQLIEDSNPDAVRILSTETIPAAHLVVNLPPDSN